jgi:hypothetical protein
MVQDGGLSADGALRFAEDRSSISNHQLSTSSPRGELANLGRIHDCLGPPSRHCGYKYRPRVAWRDRRSTIIRHAARRRQRARRGGRGQQMGFATRRWRIVTQSLIAKRSSAQICAHESEPWSRALLRPAPASRRSSCGVTRKLVATHGRSTQRIRRAPR